MAKMKLKKTKRQSSDEEEQQQCQPTPSLDHAASRLVKKDNPKSAMDEFFIAADFFVRLAFSEPMK